MKRGALLAAGLLGIGCNAGTPVVVDARVDGQTSDGGVLTEGGVCGPNDPDGGVPDGMPPTETQPYAGRCSATQVSDYAACQTDDPGKCGEFLAGQPGADCAACIETQSTAPTWGVLVFSGSQQARFNYGGCVNLALGQVGQPDSCGERIYRSYGCQEAACVFCEGQQQIGGGDAFAACEALSIASGGTCAAYDALVQDPSGPCAALQDADAAAAVGSDCFPDPALANAQDPIPQRKDLLQRMVAFFCGSPP